MILATLVGASLEEWAGWHDASSLGLLVGLVVALLVPTGKQGCDIP